MTGNFDFGLIQIKLAGRTISNLDTAQIPEVMDSASGLIKGGSSKAFGHTTKKFANSMSYSFAVKLPSTDERFLMDLSQAKPTVSFEYIYSDDSELPDGACVGLVSSDCKVSLGSADLGTEAGTLSITVSMIGYTKTFKNDEPVTAPGT